MFLWTGAWRTCIASFSSVSCMQKQNELHMFRHSAKSKFLQIGSWKLSWETWILTCGIELRLSDTLGVMDRLDCVAVKKMKLTFSYVACCPCLGGSSKYARYSFCLARACAWCSLCKLADYACMPGRIMGHVTYAYDVYSIFPNWVALLLNQHHESKPWFCWRQWMWDISKPLYLDQSLFRFWLNYTLF